MTDTVTPLVADAPEPTPEPLPDVLLGQTSFLTGAAGTGKTYLARRMAREVPGTVLAASTGIASVNLGEGTTINSLLGYFDTRSLLDAHVTGMLGGRLGKLWRSGVRRILLDEVSMVDGEQLTIITQALDELAGKGYVLDAALADEIEASDGPPGIALTLLGDFCQLPPVKAPFAFESKEWARYGDHTHKLTTIHRQADADFIRAIQAARVGDRDTCVDYFRTRLAKDSDPHFNGPTIVATNDAVDRFNRYRMSQLPTASVYFQASRWGVQPGDWKAPKIPDVLELKVGALVMILANFREPPDEEGGLPGRMIYANGDLGVVVGLDPEREIAHVKLHRNSRTEVVSMITREHTIPLEPGRRKQLRAEGNEANITEKMEIVGTVTYLPLRVAYASTVHKTQGLSLDNVQVNTREGFFKTGGMLYVALSRARTAEGLTLVGTVDGLAERCTVHPKVKGYL